MLSFFHFWLLNGTEIALFEIKLLKTEAMFGHGLTLLVIALSKLNIFKLFYRVCHGRFMIVACLIGLVEMLIKDAFLSVFELLLLTGLSQLRLILIQCLFGLFFELPLTVLYLGAWYDLSSSLLAKKLLYPF